MTETSSTRDGGIRTGASGVRPWLALLFEHLAWADERALASLRDAVHPPARAVELLAHILGAERVWLARIEQRSSELAVWPALDVERCARALSENRAAYSALLDRLGPGDLDRPVRYRNSAGVEFTSRIEDILVHVAMHGSYHRGQVALLVRDAGDEPSPTDYIAYVRGGAAATRQSGSR